MVGEQVRVQTLPMADLLAPGVHQQHMVVRVCATLHGSLGRLEQDLSLGQSSSGGQDWKPAQHDEHV